MDDGKIAIVIGNTQQTAIQWLRHRELNPNRFIVPWDIEQLKGITTEMPVLVIMGIHDTRTASLIEAAKLRFKSIRYFQY